ncbi:hypothetical protein PV783_32170 [Chitinophaga sp. CC14]
MINLNLKAKAQNTNVTPFNRDSYPGMAIYEMGAADYAVKELKRQQL